MAAVRRCDLAAGAVLVGLPAGSYGAARACWEGPRGGLWTIALAVGVVAAHWAVGITLARRRETAFTVAGLLAVFLSLPWILLVGLQADLREDRALHERGVSEQARVTEWVHTSDPVGGVEDKVTAVVLHLPGGARTTIELAGGTAPRIGTSVQVTRDPDGRAAPRLGGRPEEPDSALATLLLVLVLGLTLPPAVGAAALAHEYLE
ncbi:hypothetical protein [Streptomyces sp. NPDC047014]|uniref:hypothetical protein n=1 Tax=Streptomyces sp. NPDC047014 TaxID=3155736 RepID=UPI00340D5D2C